MNFAQAAHHGLRERRISKCCSSTSSDRARSPISTAQKLSEKELAAKYGVRFTPTFQFFGERAAALKGLPPAKREVARAPGYMRPDDFLAMFRYVREKAYEGKSFRDFVKSLPS